MGEMNSLPLKKSVGWLILECARRTSTSFSTRSNVWLSDVRVPRAGGQL